MKVLITGASSLPGYRTTLVMLDRGYEIIATYMTHEIPITHACLMKIRADIRDYQSLKTLFEEHKPNVVIHMAAYGDVDGCESNRTLAWETNVTGSINIAKLAREYSEYMLYLSTDYVFDGRRGMYSEYDPPCPINYYGLTKMCGEVATLSSGLDCSIVRASSIYGFGPGRKNFAKFLVEKLSAGEKVRALIDQFTSPTQASLLAEAISEIVERRLTGIFHVVGERLSRYDFAMKVAELFNFDKNLVEKAEMREFKWLAPRPVDASLSCKRTRETLKTDFYSTERALRTLKEEIERGPSI